MVLIRIKEDNFVCYECEKRKTKREKKKVYTSVQTTMTDVEQK